MALALTVICVGKIKETYFIQAADEYVKRLRPYAGIEVIELPSYTKDENGLAREAAAIGQRIPKNAYVVTLEIRGEVLSSEGLALRLQGLALGGVSRLAFIIGGPLGLNNSVSARADMRLSLSGMTFPHRLARIMLLEQLYRAFRIWNGEPYHK